MQHVLGPVTYTEYDLGVSQRWGDRVIETQAEATCSCEEELIAYSQGGKHLALYNLRDEHYWHRNAGRAAFEVVAEPVIVV